MKGISEDFVWGVLVSLFVAAISIIIFQFSNVGEVIYNLILIFMTFNLIITSYYAIYVMKSRSNPKERINEIKLKLKIIDIIEKEAKRAFLGRRISETTYKKIIEDNYQNEIVLKSELESLKSKK